MTPIQPVLFDKVHVKQFSGPPTTIRVNDYNVFVPRYAEGEVDLERGVYDMNNQPKKATFKYKQEGRFFSEWLRQKIKNMGK